MNSLRFIHIPKTAGTTFSRILDKQYAGENRFLFTGSIADDKDNFKKIPDLQRLDIKLFMGHAPLSTGIEYVDSIATVTFLRDPIDRVKSFCQHVSEGKSSYLLKRFPVENFDLDRFLNSGVLELSNMHCKMLTNIGACAKPIKLAPDECLKEAKANLFEKVSAFGLLEKFDESILYFKNQFNWRNPYYSKLNIKNDKKLIEFKPHHIAKIAELNNLDIRLYKLAQIEFELRLKGDVSSKQLKNFRKNNSIKKQANFFTKLKSAFKL